ncbi:unnamed protein product [Ectocarpus sp. 12 AP-2014]
MLKSTGTTKCNGCGVGIQFLLRPGSFRDPEFVLAIRTVSRAFCCCCGPCLT